MCANLKICELRANLKTHKLSVHHKMYSTSIELQCGIELYQAVSILLETTMQTGTKLHKVRAQLLATVLNCSSALKPYQVIPILFQLYWNYSADWYTIS